MCDIGTIFHNTFNYVNYIKFCINYEKIPYKFVFGSKSKSVVQTQNIKLNPDHHQILNYAVLCYYSVII